MSIPPIAWIWHNPRCSKSREALAWLEARVAPGLLHVVEYLRTPLDRETLARVADRLPGGAAALVRFKEAQAQTLGLHADAAPEVLLDALVAHPMLLERPVVLVADRAIVARPPSLLEVWWEEARGGVTAKATASGGATEGA